MSVKEIIEAITVTAELTQTQLTGPAIATMALDLTAEFSEQEIFAALTRCRRELPGRLTLSAIIDRAQSADGRPSANEAWGIALAGFDESATVVLNEEIAEAMGAARPIISMGDEVGARMAFRDAYERIVRQSRQNGIQKPKWFPSLGHDVSGRAPVIETAVQRGLLKHENVAGLLPAPITDQGHVIAGLLTGNVVEMPSDPKFRERIAELKNALKGKAA